MCNKSEEFNTPPQAYWLEQTDCREVSQSQSDTDQEISLETGMANVAYETQRRGKNDFPTKKIASAAQQPLRHSGCLARDVFPLQLRQLTASFCYCSVSSKMHLGGNMVLSKTRDHCHQKLHLDGKPA